MTGDPKETAQKRFGAPPPSNLDLILRTATDVPAVLSTLLDALRPAARADARIAELGFGPGWLLDELCRAFPVTELHGLDLSPLFASEARKKHGADVGITLGDMERLPYRDAAFDGVVTCWTLYFMRDIDAALREIRRCLRPGGIFVAATNARDHMKEYADMAAESVGAVLGRGPAPDPGERFDLTSGPGHVLRCFPNAEVRTFEGVMRLTTADDAIALLPNYGDWSVTPEETPAVVAHLRGLAAGRLARDGEIRIRRRGGAFVATVE